MLNGYATRTLIAGLLLLCAAGRAAAQPAKEQSNLQMIEREAKGILALAHPTVTFTAATYDKTTTFANGAYALTFEFTWQNAFDQPCFRVWHFHFSREGTITQIADGKTNTLFAPFALNNALLNAAKGRIRERIRSGELDANDPVVQGILGVPDMRRLTVLLLRLCQD